MKKRKPYYVIIIVLYLASVLASLFLPYLHLPAQEGVEDGYYIDYNKTAMESDIIDQIAKEEKVAKTIVYNIAKNIVAGKTGDSLKNRLKESEYYVVDIVQEKYNKKVEELESLGQLEERDYSFLGLLNLTNTIIVHFKQNVASTFTLLIAMISSIIMAAIGIIKLLHKREIKVYKTINILSFATIGISVLGLISINQISIGALQVEKFYKSNFGASFLSIIIIHFMVIVVAYIGKLHETYQGLVTFKMILRQKQLILMTIPFILYAIIFNYAPLIGWTMAFQNFKPAAKGEQMWIAWGKFQQLFEDTKFLLAFRNTVAMSVINLVLSTVVAIVFALLLNEVTKLKGKKLVQTISYLPHFLSWIIVAAIVRNALSIDGGAINELLVRLNIFDKPINFFADGKYFWWIVGFSVIWKETGWNSIIYLSSITSINPDLYEAASIDGAGRLRKMLHITLPGIKPTIFVLLIINLGMIMNSGFEAQYQLKNDLINNTAEVIDTYVLNKSFYQGADWSIGTAAGIFKSVISIILVSVANRVAKAFDQERLY